ncbi:hypothetical protein PAPYR_4237 [Paratrimastix pyriformis]|uniref:Uncharacterized protein n=1 Tax=Paratrimastix pyriformis TaxID=342808 RepID=A0ABQ8UMY4_9EUKA|nr:hypothetical protein PAPYR_4237 [Paratrimastix pyriformis]
MYFVRRQTELIRQNLLACVAEYEKALKRAEWANRDPILPNDRGSMAETVSVSTPYPQSTPTIISSSAPGGGGGGGPSEAGADRSTTGATGAGGPVSSLSEQALVRTLVWDLSESFLAIQAFSLDQLTTAAQISQFVHQLCDRCLTKMTGIFAKRSMALWKFASSFLEVNQAKNQEMLASLFTQASLFYGDRVIALAVDPIRRLQVRCLIQFGQ